MALVYLPLEGQVAKKKDFSPDDQETLLNEFLNPADYIITFVFRYARMHDRDLHTRFGEEIVTHGGPLDYTNSHPWAAFLTSGLLIGAGLISAAMEYAEMQKREAEEHEELNRSYRTINKKLLQKQVDEKVHNDNKKLNDAYFLKLKEAHRKREIEELNSYLEKVLADNPVLNKQYNTVTIEEGKQEGEPLRLVFNKKDQIKPQPLIGERIWSALGLTTFVYWIAYGLSGIHGDFGNFGATNLPGFGFGISLLAGAAYLGHCAYDSYKKHKRAQSGIPDLADIEDARNGVYLLQECQKRREYDLTKKALEEKFGIGTLSTVKQSYDKTIKPAPEPQKKNGLVDATWLSSFVGSYITLQYVAWLAVDIVAQAASIILPEIKLVQFAAGIFIFAGAAIYGLFKADQASKKYGGSEEPAATIPKKTAEEIYAERIQTINGLKHNLLGKPYNGGVIDGSMLSVAKPPVITIQPKYTPPPKTTWETVKDVGKRSLKVLLKFAGSFMTGAMLARCFLVGGSATFLPFTALALSNPWTLGLVIGIGVAWGMFQFYKQYQEFKAEEEQQAKLEAEKKNAEYVHAIQKADLQIAALKKLEDKVHAEVLNNKQKDVVEIPEHKQLANQSKLAVSAEKTENIPSVKQHGVRLFSSSQPAGSAPEVEPTPLKQDAIIADNTLKQPLLLSARA